MTNENQLVLNNTHEIFKEKVSSQLIEVPKLLNPSKEEFNISIFYSSSTPL